MKKKVLSMMLACGMALSLAACGSSSNNSSASTSGSAASTSSKSESSSDSSSAASTSTADLPVVEAGKLHMATNAAFPPYEMTTDDGGYTGIDVEVAELIAEKLGLELVVDDMDFSSVITSVQSGKSDIAMAGLTVNEERKKNVDFTDTYATSVQVVIVPEDSDIATVDDLANDKLIGCQEGTTGYTLCSSEPEDGGYGADHTIAYANGATAIQALTSGKVDAVVIDSAPAEEFVKANEGLKILDTEFANEEYAIGIEKEKPELLEAVNLALTELKDDGTLQSIMDKYMAK